MIYGFTNTVWENLDILLILNCLDPGKFLGANMAYGLYTLCYMTLKSSCLKVAQCLT